MIVVKHIYICYVFSFFFFILTLAMLMCYFLFVLQEFTTLELIQSMSSLHAGINVTAHLISNLVNIEISNLHIFILAPKEEYFSLVQHKFGSSLRSLILPSLFNDRTITAQFIIDLLNKTLNINKLHLIGYGPFTGITNPQFTQLFVSSDEYLFDFEERQALQSDESLLTNNEINIQNIGSSSSSIWMPQPSGAHSPTAMTNFISRPMLPSRRSSVSSMSSHGSISPTVSSVSSISSINTTAINQLSPNRNLNVDISKNNKQNIQVSKKHNLLAIKDLSLNLFDVIDHPSSFCDQFCTMLKKTSTISKLRLCNIDCPFEADFYSLIMEASNHRSHCLKLSVSTLIQSLFEHEEKNQSNLEILDLRLMTHNCDFIVWYLLDYLNEIDCIHIKYDKHYNYMSDNNNLSSSVLNPTIVNILNKSLIHFDICQSDEKHLSFSSQIVVILKEKDKQIIHKNNNNNNNNNSKHLMFDKRATCHVPGLDVDDAYISNLSLRKDNRNKKNKNNKNDNGQKSIKSKVGSSTDKHKRKFKRSTNLLKRRKSLEMDLFNVNLNDHNGKNKHKHGSKYEYSMTLQKEWIATQKQEIMRQGYHATQAVKTGQLLRNYDKANDLVSHSPESMNNNNNNINNNNNSSGNVSKSKNDRSKSNNSCNSDNTNSSFDSCNVSTESNLEPLTNYIDDHSFFDEMRRKSKRNNCISLNQLQCNTMRAIRNYDACIDDEICNKTNRNVNCTSFLDCDSNNNNNNSISNKALKYGNWQYFLDIFEKNCAERSKKENEKEDEEKYQLWKKKFEISRDFEGAANKIVREANGSTTNKGDEDGDGDVKVNRVINLENMNMYNNCNTNMDENSGLRESSAGIMSCTSDTSMDSSNVNTISTMGSDIESVSVTPASVKDESLDVEYGYLENQTHQHVINENFAKFKKKIQCRLDGNNKHSLELKNWLKFDVVTFHYNTSND